MKIAIAQIKSLRGNIQKNIENHLVFIERAIKLKADVIIFPELSITNYEPQLAQELAIEVNSPILNPFQDISDIHDITIGVGMPTKTVDGIAISMLIFQPNIKRTIYSKQLLHEDELPYFVSVKQQAIVNIKGIKIGIGICYESLQREHFLNAKNQGADIYIASVAKPKGGIEKAYLYFPVIAKEFNIPILMSNSIGYCDNFLSFGQSAIWNKNGKLKNQLDDSNEGLLLFDTESETVKSEQLKIEKGNLSNIDEIFQVYQDAKEELDKKDIFQWTNNYPTLSIIENDLKKDSLFVLKNNEKIIGAICINEEQEFEYKKIKWKYNQSKVLIIHRLVIDPKYQGKGYAKIVMDFVEKLAFDNNFSSIRLDAYSQNKRVIIFYEKRKYCFRGEIYFPERTSPFYAMEKEIITSDSIFQKFN